MSSVRRRGVANLSTQATVSAASCSRKRLFDFARPGHRGRAAPLLSLFVDVVARSPSVGLPHEQDAYRKAEAANDQVYEHCTHNQASCRR